mgnify:CR=1 FL=1
MSVEENITGPSYQGVQIAGFSSPPPEVSPPGVQSFPDSAAGAAAGPAGDGAAPGPAGAIEEKERECFHAGALHGSNYSGMPGHCREYLREITAEGL